MERARDGRTTAKAEARGNGVQQYKQLNLPPDDVKGCCKARTMTSLGVSRETFIVRCFVFLCFVVIMRKLGKASSMVWYQYLPSIQRLSDKFDTNMSG